MDGKYSLELSIEFYEADLIPDKRLIALGATSCFFEGSMYIFIFFKFPALKLSHKLAGGDETGMSKSQTPPFPLSL